MTDREQEALRELVERMLVKSGIPDEEIATISADIFSSIVHQAALPNGSTHTIVPDMVLKDHRLRVGAKVLMVGALALAYRTPFFTMDDLRAVPVLGWADMDEAIADLIAFGYVNEEPDGTVTLFPGCGPSTAGGKE
jgi:hypothetical protein